MWMLLAALILHVDAGSDDLRLVSDGTGADPVDWYVDGAWVATTWDGQAATVATDGGRVSLLAHAQHDGPWMAMARNDGPADGLMHVPATVERQVGVARAVPVESWVMCAVGAVMVLVAPVRIALEAWPPWQPRGD